MTPMTRLSFRSARFVNALTALGLTALAGSAGAAPPGVRYVAIDAPPGGDGLSWATAYRSLEQALTAAGSSGGAVTELWVKAGSYRPSIAFTLASGVGVYGGFTGVETERDQRDFDANLTVLYGDSAVNNVVIGAGNASTVLDGFTITEGKTTATTKTGPGWAGGGMHVTGSPTIRNCIITGNIGGRIFQFDSFTRSGAGVYCAPGSAATFADCVIAGNWFDRSTSYGLPAGRGAGLAAENCSVTLTRCVITNNTTGIGSYFGCGGGFLIGGGDGGDGGGIHLTQAAALIVDCRIADNVTGTADKPGTCGTQGTQTGHGRHGGDGAGLYAVGSAAVLVNTVIADNLTGDGAPGGEALFSSGDGGNGGDGGAVWASEGTIELINCTLAGNRVGGAGVGGDPGQWGSTTWPGGDSGIAGQGAGIFGSSTVRLTNCIVWNEGVTELVGSPLASYSDIRGQTAYPGAGNINADPRFVNIHVGDYRLAADSPCIDAGNSLVDIDPATPGTQPLPATDADGLARRVDIASVPDTGVGAPVVDMGAYEVQNDCIVDLNGDGIVDFSDYLEFLNLFDAGDLRVDFTGDGLVDFSDYLEFLNLFDAGC